MSDSPRAAPGIAPGRAVLGGVLAAALALRLWHLHSGLPDFVEEAIPFRRALAMWGWTTGQPDWNPHFFHYPSLSLYLHHLLQRAHVAWGIAAGAFANPYDYYLTFRLDPTTMVVLARLLGVAADLASVLGAAVIAERLRPGAGWVAATLVAMAPVLILSARLIHPDPMMTTLAVWAVERMLAYRAAGGAARLAAAVTLVGLAVGTKYPAILLLAPLVWVLIARHGARAVPIGASCAGVLVVTLLTSPFVLVDLPIFLRDLRFVGQLPGEGHLGSLEARAFLFHLGHLGRDLGWVAVLLLAASLAMLVLSRPVRGAQAVVWLALLAFAVPISLARIEAERYLVPVIPFAAVLAAVATLDLAARAPRRWARVLQPALLALLLLPAAFGGVRAAASGAGQTQIEARRWCQERLTADDLLLQEAHGIQLLTRAERAHDDPAARRASARFRERYLAQPVFRVVTVPLSVAGQCVSRVPAPDGRVVEVPIFDHVADFNRLFYDPRLLDGVSYVLTSSAVRGRFEADPERFADAVRFYRLLDESADVAARFVSRPGVAGPVITIYRLGARAESTIVARHGRLDPWWWAAAIPGAYRERAHTILGADRPVTEYAGRDGRPAPWVASLAEVFEERIHPFASQMADQLADLGVCEPAARMAAASLEMAPAHLGDCMVLTTCAGRLGRWDEARGAVERAMAAAAPGDPAIPEFQLERARILLHQGESALARAELERLLAAPVAADDQRAAARRGLEALERTEGGGMPR